jgi:hypothetical protein
MPVTESALTGPGPLVYHFAPTPLYREVIAIEGLVPQVITDPTVVNFIPDHPVLEGIFVWHSSVVTDSLLRDFLLVQFTKRLVFDGTLLAFRADPAHLWSVQVEDWKPSPEDDYRLSHSLDVDATAQCQRYVHKLHERIPMDLYLAPVPAHKLHAFKRCHVAVEFCR